MQRIINIQVIIIEDADKFARDNYEAVLNDIREITRIPSPSYKESEKIKHIEKYAKRIGYANSEIDKAGNLRVYLSGMSDMTDVFSAHADTVFGMNTKLEITEDEKIIKCPSVCDNTTGIAGLLYLMRYVKSNGIVPKNNVCFLFNVCEEGEGNLKGIRHFFDSIDKTKINQHICVEGHTIGRITRTVVGSMRYRVSITGKGGHSWRDYGNENTIVTASRMIDELSRMELPADPKTTMNIGVMNGGTSVNSIPERTEFTLEVRSVDSDIIKKTDAYIRKKIRKHSQKADISLIGERPCGIIRDDEAYSKISVIHKSMGIKTIEDIGSTDSNYPLSIGIKSVTIGITEAHNTHSLGEYIVKEPIKKGLSQLIRIFTEMEIKKLIQGRRESLLRPL